MHFIFYVWSEIEKAKRYGSFLGNEGNDYRFKEIVELIRAHNNANILCIPARFTAIHQALEMVDVFLTTKFEGGRHQARIDKIPLHC